MSNIKAVISTGSKQYLVQEGDVLEVEKLLASESLNFKPLLVIKDDQIIIGQPLLDNFQVTASIVNQEVLDDKVLSIRYKAKKRVKTVRGHRQIKTQIKITSIK